MTVEQTPNVRRDTLRAVEQAIAAGYVLQGKAKSAFAKRIELAEIIAPWKTTTTTTLKQLPGGVVWATAIDDAPLTQFGLQSATDYLSVFKWRLRDRHDPDLTVEDLDLLRKRVWLEYWSSHLIQQGLGRGFPNYTQQEAKEFSARLEDELRSTITWVASHDEVLERLMKGLVAIVDDHYDGFSRPLDLAEVKAWHLGWAILPVAWLLADIVGDSIPCGRLRLCRFPEAQHARLAYQDTGTVTCPRCQAEITPGDDPFAGNSDFAAVEAMCESCELVVYFPEQALPESLWNGPLIGMLKKAPQDLSVEAEQGERQLIHPLIFISHASSDLELAKSLVACLESCMDVPDNGIRCTSVPGYRLAPGDVSDEVLRDNIESCAVVIGLLTEQSLSSGYVIMELGAAWGLKKMTYAVLAAGAHFGQIPGPLARLHAIKADADHDVASLIEVVAEKTGLSQRNRAKFTSGVNSFVLAAKAL